MHAESTFLKEKFSLFSSLTEISLSLVKVGMLDYLRHLETKAPIWQHKALYGGVESWVAVTFLWAAAAWKWGVAHRDSINAVNWGRGSTWPGREEEYPSGTSMWQDPSLCF